MKGVWTVVKGVRVGGGGGGQRKRGKTKRGGQDEEGRARLDFRCRETQVS